MDSATDKDMQVPVINLSKLRQDSQTRSLAIKQVHEACRTAGIFHVINHGIPEIVLDEALNVNFNFFGLPLIDKVGFISNDSSKPLRYGQNQGEVQGFFRDFLKLYAHPLEEFVASWPKNPPDYREKMGSCVKEMRKLAMELMEAVMESLNLEATYLKEEIEQGVNLVAINHYPPFSKFETKTIGLHPHSDYGIISILLQSCRGLQVMDKSDNTWKCVPELKGSVQVVVGDLLEVLSNGKYKSVLHRAIQTSTDKNRLCIVSFHSLGMDEIIEPATELVDEENPKRYKGSCVRDFQTHLASGEAKPFVETLKIASARTSDKAS